MTGCFNPSETITAAEAADTGTTSRSTISRGDSDATGHETADAEDDGTTGSPSASTATTSESEETEDGSADSTGSGTQFCGLPAPLAAFAEPDVYSAGESAVFVVVADMFGSPGAEIIVGDPVLNEITIWQNNELLAQFALATTLQVPPDGWQPAVGDLSGNGRNDLAVSDGQRVWTWISDGKSLARGQNQPLAQTPGWGVVIADVGGSAFGDVVVQSNPSSGPTLEVFPGMGGGVAPTAFSIQGGRRTPSLVAANMDGDAYADLIVPRTDADREVDPDGLDILLSRPTKDGFGFEVRSFETGPTPWGVAVADFNEDGFNDVLIAHQGLTPADGAIDTVQVWLGDGDGDLAPQPEVEVADTLGFPAVGDVDCDGHIDAIVPAVDGVYMLAGDGDGGLGAPTRLFAPGVAGAVAVGQLNADSRLDIVVGLAGEGEIQVYYAD